MPVKKDRLNRKPGLVSLRYRLTGATAQATAIAALGLSFGAWAQSVDTKAAPSGPSVTYSGGTGSPSYSDTVVPTEPAPGHVTDQTDQPQAGVKLNGGVAPPAASPPQVDERPLWALYKAHRLDELHRRVAQIQAANPGWQPPADLVNAEGAATVGAALSKQAQGGNFKGALALKDQHPEQFDCKNIGNSWNLAHVAVAAGQPKTAFGIYKHLLATCTNEPDRIRTIELYGSAGGYDEAYQLLGREASRVTAQSDLDLLAKAVTTLDIAHFSALVYANKSAQAKALAPRLSALIVATHNVDGISALGWLAMKQNNPQGAIPWFTRAMALQPGPQTAANLAQAYMGAGQYDKAQELLARYAGSPALASIRRGLTMQQADAAYKAGRYDDVIILADAAHKQGLQSVDLDLMRAWSLYHLGRSEAADGFIELATKNAATPAVADQASVGLIYAVLQQCAAPGSMPGGPLSGGVADPVAELPVLPPPSVQSEPDCVARAVDRRDKTLVNGIINSFAQRLLHGRPDAKAAIALGWYSLQTGNQEAALQWFGNGQKWTRDTETLAQAKAGFALTLQAMARKAYVDKRYSDSLAYLKAGAAIHPADTADTLLTAWNNYQLHHYAQARLGFQSVYVKQKDRESAEGLIAVAQAENQLSTLDNLTGPIHPMVMGAHADEAYDREQFLYALSLSATRHPDLGGYDAPITSVDFGYRNKSGTSGQGKLSGPTVALAQTLNTGIDQWTLAVRIEDLSSGTSRNNSGANTLVPGGRTGLVAAPELSWQRKAGTMEYQAALGLSPIGGALAPTVTGRLGAVVLQGDDRYGLMIKRQIVEESVLSISGVHDALTGVTFGRVAETSANFTGFHYLGANWGVSGGLELGYLDGVHVRGNGKIGATLSVAKNVAPLLDATKDRFSYLSIGPQYSFEAFQHNLSGYTQGQGGYYSPQFFQQVGAGLNFETKPVGKVVARGGASVGWQQSRQNAQTLNSAFQAGSHNSDLGGSVFFDMSYMLLPQILLDAGFSYTATPTYNDTTATLGMHVPLHKRKAATTSDLPLDLVHP